MFLIFLSFIANAKFQSNNNKFNQNNIGFWDEVFSDISSDNTIAIKETLFLQKNKLDLTKY